MRKKTKTVLCSRFKVGKCMKRSVIGARACWIKWSNKSSRLRRLRRPPRSLKHWAWPLPLPECSSRTITVRIVVYSLICHWWSRASSPSNRMKGLDLMRCLQRAQLEPWITSMIVICCKSWRISVCKKTKQIRRESQLSCNYKRVKCSTRGWRSTSKKLATTLNISLWLPNITVRKGERSINLSTSTELTKNY